MAATSVINIAKQPQIRTPLFTPFYMGDDVVRRLFVRYAGWKVGQKMDANGAGVYNRLKVEYSSFAAHTIVNQQTVKED